MQELQYTIKSIGIFREWAVNDLGYSSIQEFIRSELSK